MALSRVQRQIAFFEMFVIVVLAGAILFRNRQSNFIDNLASLQLVAEFGPFPFCGDGIDLSGQHLNLGSIVAVCFAAALTFQFCHSVCMSSIECILCQHCPCVFRRGVDA